MKRSPDRRALACSCLSVLLGLAACTNDYAALDVSGTRADASAPGAGGEPGGDASAGGSGTDGSGGAVTAAGGAPVGGRDASTDGGEPLDASADGSDASETGAPDAEAGADGSAESGAGGSGAGGTDAGTGGGAGAGGVGTGGSGGSGGTGAGGTPPDAGPSSCDTLYGATAGYQLCTQTASACRFYAALGGTSCGALCGAACIDQDDNNGPCAVSNAADTCAGPARQNAICECARR